jgi:prepilin-type processing-associated H-X9-DG protein
MLGEKYLSPDEYFTGTDHGDDHGIYEGCGVDTQKWCDYYDPTNRIGRTPRQDTPGLQLFWSFGSAHAGACSFVFCDGSVRMISYDIDPLVHSHLGSAFDGQAVSLEDL